MQRVVVAGATGAVGRILCRLLLTDGWQVIGTTRRTEGAVELARLGVEPLIVDVFDRDALLHAVASVQPSVMVHQLTDLPKVWAPERRAEVLERNALLREVGTRHLADACVMAGVGTLVAQSIAFAYAPGPEPCSEAAPLDVDNPDPVAARSARAVQTLERLVLGGPFRGVVLRYGKFYGPGTWTNQPPEGGPVHVEAAADAARRAILRGPPGIYNVAEPDGTVDVTKAIRELGWQPAFRESP